MQCCPVCGDSNIDYDAYRGATMCMGCGEVLEESRVISELTFSQTGEGHSNVSGQRVSSYTISGGSRDRLGFWTPSGVALSGQAALSTTLHRGGQKIEWIAQRLGLRSSITDEGKRMFQLAAQRNFTSGRKTAHVAAACLYIVCRKEREPYLLLDFSDALNAPVREIGQIYMRLVRLLNLDKLLDIPVIDPSLFMERFSNKLQLGQKGSQLVSHTATRLIQAMNRDWICTGRRPTGLCGAALLIACQYHGFPRSPAALAEVVKGVGEVTIRRRLTELQNTSTAALTVEQFEAVADSTDALAMPSEALPPSLIRNREKEEKKLKQILNGTAPFAPAKPRLVAGDGLERQILDVAETVLATIGGSEGVASFAKCEDGDDEEDVEVAALADDDAIDAELLTEAEAAEKSAIWHEWNKLYLEEWETRRREKAAAATGETGTKKRKSPGTRTPMGPQASAAESTRLAISKKAKLLGNRVDADVLQSLLQ